MKIRDEKKVLYGSETKKSLEIFRISGLKTDEAFIRSIVLIKKTAATVNGNLGLINKISEKKIINACNRILKGNYPEQFLVDVFHSGAGTSLHMNVNEVIACISGTDSHDEVNMAQSTNDVLPAALRITSLKLINNFEKTLNRVIKTLHKKGSDFGLIIKAGRTHLTDALPVTLGGEFKAYASALAKDRRRILTACKNLRELGIGGTAVGTGVNSHPQYAGMMIIELNKSSSLQLKLADNLQEAMQNRSDFLDLSAALRTCAQNLVRIGNDLRLMSSGPGTGLSEIILPEVIPGSSIMPGKINPSVIEMLTMVCFQVIAMDQAIILGCMHGELELNVFLPVIAFNLINQIKFLTNALTVFNKNCLEGITADKEMISFWLYRSKGTVALLNPYLGYEKSAGLLKESLRTGINIADLTVKKGYLTRKQVLQIFNFKKIIKPNLEMLKK